MMTTISADDLQTLVERRVLPLADIELWARLEATNAILEVLRDADRPMRCKEIAEQGEAGFAFVKAALGRLVRIGMVERVPLGDELIPMGYDDTYRKVNVVGFVLR